MPLPVPSASESEADFVSRFMGDEQAVADFPDEKQRVAVAYKQYRDEEMEEMQLPSVSILEEGEAKGHDLFVDKTSLERALEIMSDAKNGVKVKMNHGSGLDAVVGFARNPRIEGNKLIADLKLLKNSPHYGLIKEMASEAPDQFGISLAFVNESETIDGKNFIRPQSIASADLVSSPAATNGLFEEMLAFMEKVKRFDCGTGAGGFKPGNSCASGGGGGGGESEKKSNADDSDNSPAKAREQREKNRQISKEVRAASNDFKDNVIPESERSDTEINKDIDRLNKIENAVSRGDYQNAREHMNDLSTEAWDSLYKSGVHEKINANSVPIGEKQSSSSGSEINKAAIPRKAPVTNPGPNDDEYGKKLLPRVKEQISKQRENLKTHISDAKDIKITSQDDGWTGSRSIHADNIKGILGEFKKNTASHRYGPTTDKQRQYYSQVAKMLRNDAEKMYGGMGKDKIGSKWDNLAYSATEAADAIEKMAYKSFEEAVNEMREKIDFCWSGYAPVAGKKPYSEGSCVKAEMGYVEGGKTISDDMAENKKENLTNTEENMGTDNNSDMENIKTRLEALEKLMMPKDESKDSQPSDEMKQDKEMKPEEMSAVVKKVLTEFGIKPVPASPVIEESSKKEELKNFEALVSAHPEYKTSKLNAMKAVMLSNPNEYREALARGIKNI